HRLAFIFRGALLDVGTPDAIVERRALRAAEVQVDRAVEAAALLRGDPAVEEVAHYGHMLRVVTRDGSDPAAVAAGALRGHGIEVQSTREQRVTVEDAFVAMVRADARAAREEKARA
ncbi:MAG TPA: hypothetical protein VH044_12070, partial [Polyangiaceae bacterium]|nr:hypothetical protein [Polyangiaceae bacterium]